MIIDDTAKALGSVLASGTAVTGLLTHGSAIYHMQAPDNCGYPYVVYSHQAGGPLNINPSLLEDNVWWVRAYSTTSAASAGSVFTAVDTKLNRVNIAITNATTIQCIREQNIALVENSASGVKVYTSGGMYRIKTTNT